MQRGRPLGTATSAVPSNGTSVQPGRRAARAGYSAVRSGDDVKMALSTSAGSKPFASRSAASSSSVAARIASLVFAVAVVAPRRPRRILVMALVDQLRFMVITDPVLLKGRDAVTVCRAAVQGGATMIQVRWKDGVPAEVLELTRSLVAALPVPILVNDRADVALAAGAAGVHLGWEDVPLDALRPHVPSGRRKRLRGRLRCLRTIGASGRVLRLRTSPMRVRRWGRRASGPSRDLRPRG